MPIANRSMKLCWGFANWDLALTFGDVGPPPSHQPKIKTRHLKPPWQKSRNNLRCWKAPAKETLTRESLKHTESENPEVPLPILERKKHTSTYAITKDSTNIFTPQTFNWDSKWPCEAMKHGSSSTHLPSHTSCAKPSTLFDDLQWFWVLHFIHHWHCESIIATISSEGKWWYRWDATIHNQPHIHLTYSGYLLYIPFKNLQRALLVKQLGAPTIFPMTTMTTGIFQKSPASFLHVFEKGLWVGNLTASQVGWPRAAFRICCEYKY